MCVLKQTLDGTAELSYRCVFAEVPARRVCFVWTLLRSCSSSVRASVSLSSRRDRRVFSFSSSGLVFLSSSSSVILDSREEQVLIYKSSKQHLQYFSLIGQHGPLSLTFPLSKLLLPSDCSWLSLFQVQRPLLSLKELMRFLSWAWVCEVYWGTPLFWHLDIENERHHIDWQTCKYAVVWVFWMLTDLFTQSCCRMFFTSDGLHCPSSLSRLSSSSSSEAALPSTALCRHSASTHRTTSLKSEDLHQHAPSLQSIYDLLMCMRGGQHPILTDFTSFSLFRFFLSCSKQ